MQNSARCLKRQCTNIRQLEVCLCLLVSVCLVGGWGVVQGSSRDWQSAPICMPSAGSHVTMLHGDKQTKIYSYLVGGKLSVLPMTLIGPSTHILLQSFCPYAGYEYISSETIWPVCRVTFLEFVQWRQVLVWCGQAVHVQVNQDPNRWEMLLQWTGYHFKTASMYHINVIYQARDSFTLAWKCTKSHTVSLCHLYKKWTFLVLLYSSKYSI